MLDTFRLLPAASYWVHEFEVDEYRKRNEGIKIEILPDELRGNIAKVRNFILRKTLPYCDVSVQMDDDVHYIGYWERRKAYRMVREKKILDMIERYSSLAKEWGVRLWGINADKQVYREYTPFSLLSYVSASFSCFMGSNQIYYDERFMLCEDYDMTLQQIDRHRKLLRVNKFFYSKKGAEQAGGCAVYRNLEKEKAQTELLQKKWGSKIVRFDTHSGRSHSSTKVKKRIDINPIIRVPIKGV